MEGWSARSCSQVSFESHEELLEEGGTVYRALGVPPGNTPSKAAKFLVVRFGLYDLLYRPVTAISTGEIRKTHDCDGEVKCLAMHAGYLVYATGSAFGAGSTVCVHEVDGSQQSAHKKVHEFQVEDANVTCNAAATRARASRRTAHGSVASVGRAVASVEHA